jgi:hypothetical protein
VTKPFLEAAKNDTIWNKAKAVVRDKGGVLTSMVLSEIVKDMAKKVAGLA